MNIAVCVQVMEWTIFLALNSLYVSVKTLWCCSVMDAFNSSRQECNQIEQFPFLFMDQVDTLTSWLEVMFTTKLQQHTLLPENLTGLVLFCRAFVYARNCHECLFQSDCWKGDNVPQCLFCFYFCNSCSHLILVDFCPPNRVFRFSLLC